MVTKVMNFSMADSVRITPSLRGESSGRQEVREGGFSLIELMVVIGIMAIILAVALPIYNQWRQSTALSTASQTLMAHLKQARVMAVSNNRQVSVTFTANSYTVDSAGSNPQQYLLSDYAKGLTLSTTFASNTLNFFSNGVSDTSSNKDTVTITNSSGASKTITVNIVGQVT